MRVFGLLIVLFLAMQGVYAATLSGGVYDNDLNSVSNVVIYVNTTPQQKHVSRFGGFSFTLNPGIYHISVNYTSGEFTQVVAEDFITITDDNGQYRRDIFLFNGVDLTQQLNESQQTTNESGQITDPSQFTAWWIVWLVVGLAVIFMLLTILFIALKKPKREDETTIAGRELVIELLKDHKGSLSQKALRKQLPMSESKVSMLLTELEKEGSVEKQKKGRVNIIKLK